MGAGEENVKEGDVTILGLLCYYKMMLVYFSQWHVYFFTTGFWALLTGPR